MAQNKRKYLDLSHIFKALDLFTDDDPLIKTNKLNEENKEYLKQFNEHSRETAYILVNAERKASLSPAIQTVIKSLRSFAFSKFLLPERDAVYKRIVNHVNEGLYELEAIDEKGNKEKLPRNITTEQLQTLTKSGVKLMASSDNPSHVDLFEKMRLLTRISADTAYASKAYDPRRKRVIYITAIGHKILKNLKEWHGDESDGFYKGVSTVYAHELLHILKLHLENWWRRYYKNLSGNDFNVLFDAEINSDLLRSTPDVAKALLDHVGIRASTIPKFTLPVFIVEAARTSKDIEGFRQNLNTLLDKYVRPFSSEEEKMGLERFLNEELNEDIIKELHANISNKKAQHAGNFIKSRLGNGTIDFIRKKYEARMINDRVYESFDKMLKSESFVDLLEFIKVNMEEREAGTKTPALNKEWLKTYDALRELFPKKGGGGGFEEGEPWEDYDNDDATTEVDEEEAIRSERELNKAVEKIKENIKKAGLGGDADIYEKLDATDVDGLLKAKLKKALNMITELPQLSYERTLVPAYKNVLMPAIIEREKQMKEIIGRDVSIPLPKGTTSIKEIPEAHPNIVFAVFDESASVSGKELSIFKATLTDACSELDAAVIAVSMSDTPETAHFTGFNPRKPKTKEEFMYRFKSGGTQGFEKWIYDLDELLQSSENLSEKLGKVVQDMGLANDPKEGAKYLLELWEQGKIRGIVFTDGGLFPEQLPPEKIDKYMKYAEKVKTAYNSRAFEGGPIKRNNVPLVYISSQRNYTEPWSNLSKNELDKLRHWIIHSVHA